MQARGQYRQRHTFNNEHQRLKSERQAAFKSQKLHSGAIGCAHDVGLIGSGDVFLKNSWTRAEVRNMIEKHL